MWFLISAADLESYLDEGRNIYLIDLRNREAFDQEHIRGAVSLPGYELAEQVWRLPADRLVVLYCYHGPQSMLAARKLARRNYRVADLCGGIQAYRDYRGKHLVRDIAR